LLFANRRPAHEIVAMSFIETLDNLALKKSELVERFENLIAPKSDQALEAMAQASRSLTRQNFGRTMRLFAPLYLSNECINNCRYCGFSRDNPILRVTLDVDEVVAEGQHLAHQGFRQILLVAGEHPKFVSRDYLAECVRALAPDFSSISIEVGPMDTEDYVPVVEAGAEGLVVEGSGQLDRGHVLEQPDQLLQRERLLRRGGDEVPDGLHVLLGHADHQVGLLDVVDAQPAGPVGGDVGVALQGRVLGLHGGGVPVQGRDPGR